MSDKSLDNEIVRLWKELTPSGAYLLGWDEYAGKLFIPSEQNIADAIQKVRALRRRAENDVQSKILDSMEVTLLFPEPQPILDDIVSTVFGHLTKEGVNEKHLSSLIANASRAVDATQKRFKSKEVPVAVKALTLYRLDGILEVLQTVKGVAKSKSLKADCDRLAEKVKRFVALFQLEGFGKGTFEEVENVFRKYKFDLGRKDFYRVALEGGFDYTETPDELEKKAMAWIEEELPKYRDVVKRLAKHYRCAPDPEVVERKVVERQSLKPKDLLKITNAVRKVVQDFVDESVVKINKKYKTKVIETPPYPERDATDRGSELLRHLHQEALPGLLPHHRPEAGTRRSRSPSCWTCWSTRSTGTASTTRTAPSTSPARRPTSSSSTSSPTAR